MRRIKDEEYKTLRDEMNMRIQLMNTHNLGMITAVFAVWAIAGVMFKEYVEIILDYTCSDIKIAVILFTVLIPLFILLPIAVILPLSVKSGDNLGQIMSISAYIKLYMEMPSYYKDKTEFIGWESLQKKEMERKLSDKFFNSEYIILSALSVGMFIIVSAIMCVYGIDAGYNDIYYILPILVLFAVLGIVATVFILRKSSTSLFLSHRNDYYKRYCDFAVQTGAFTQKEIDDYNRYIEGGL